MNDKTLSPLYRTTRLSHSENNIDIPLVVDLDGTLIKTDLLYEGTNRFILQHPLHCLRVVRQFLKGKAALKAYLAERCAIEPALLPYNHQVIAWLRKEKRLGRRLILATASHIQLAQTIAEYLELFDEVLATEGDDNLKAQKKREALITSFGERGFDYLGDSNADKSIWVVANRAHVVTSSDSVKKWGAKQNNVDQVFSNETPPFRKSCLKLLRPHQWTKNLLIFVPLVCAHEYNETTSIVSALLAFLIFCLAASSVYVLNDLVDINDDRHNHYKRNRPLAAGDLPLWVGWLVWPLLLTMAFTLSFLVMPLGFSTALGIYCATTFTYSFYGKKKPILDVLILAGLYVLRVIAGAEAIAVPLSYWLLTFSTFIFLSLAFLKRSGELRSTVGRNSNNRKLRGRGYMPTDLAIISSMGIAGGYVSVVVLALYLQEDNISELYRNPTLLWPACLLLIYWLSRAWLITSRGQMHDDPIVFAIKDKVSWIIFTLFLLLFALAKYTA